jgi:hypothetical protein
MSKKEANRIYVKKYGVKIGQEDHTLQFGLEAFAALEDAGYEYEQIIEWATTVTFNGISALLWAGTRHEYEDKPDDLPISEIKKMVDLKGFIECQGTVQKALLNALPTEEPGESSGKKPGPEKKTSQE